MTILNQVRLQQKKTRKEMAKELGLKYYTYRSYEQGVREIPPRILRKVLLMRGCDEDKRLAKILEEVYEV